MMRKPLKLCMYIETFEELVIAEKAVNVIYFTEEGYGDIAFPVVYFYDHTAIGGTDYDLYMYTNDIYDSVFHFKRKTYDYLLNTFPELIPLTIADLERDYPEYLI